MSDAPKGAQDSTPHPPFGLHHTWAEKVLSHLHALRLLDVFPIPIEEIRKAVANLSGSPEIQLRPVNAPEPVVILGRFVSKEYFREGSSRPLHRIMIDYEKKQSLDEQRFIITKELCHTFYSATETTRSVTGEQMIALIEGIAALNQNTVILQPQSPALNVEQAALHTAIEILCPFEIRDDIVKAHNNNYDQIPIKKHSEQFGVSEEVLSQIFTVGYHDNARISRSLTLISKDALPEA